MVAAADSAVAALDQHSLKVHAFHFICLWELLYLYSTNKIEYKTQ